MMKREFLVLLAAGVFLFSLSVLPNEIFAPSHPEYQGVESPRKQISQGIEPEDVICREGLVLIIKHNGSPACVRSETVDNLENRGWGVMPTPLGKKLHQLVPEHVDSQSSKQIQSLKQECSGNAKCFSGIVTQVTDGDTINVDGIQIRFALSSAPELYDFEGEESRELIDTICPVGSNALVDEDDGQTGGSYGRIIAVIYCNDKNLNSELLDSGFGYLALEFCSKSEFASSSWVQKYGCQSINESKTPLEPKSLKNGCDPSYPDFCIPYSPPDLDCKDITQKRFTVLPPDPHRFDGDKDGIGCK